MKDDRLSDLKKFYKLIAEIKIIIGGAHKLSECLGRKKCPGHMKCPSPMGWSDRVDPKQNMGVYFFQENSENQRDTGEGPRIVRVGTSKALCNRFRQTKGNSSKGNLSGGGNHRASVFRRLIGDALINRDNLEYPTWEHKPISKEDRERELPLERDVSKVIGKIPFLWLVVNDEPGKESDRGYIERNAIALLSNYGKKDKEVLDRQSCGWLGQHSSRKKVQKSRLWNSNHVNDKYDPNFLEKMKKYICQMEKKKN